MKTIKRYLATENLNDLLDSGDTVSYGYTKQEELDACEDGAEVTLYEVTFTPIKSGTVRIKYKAILE